MYWFLPCINMNQPQVYICPLPLEPPSLLPPPPTPASCHRVPGLSSCVMIANSHWLSILCMVVHMFLCYSLHLPHPLLPPPVSASLFSMSVSHCCPANRLINAVFLDYALKYDTCFSDLTLYDRHQVHPPH